MEPTHSILLAEEDASMRGFLADNLAADGYRVLTVDSRMAALTTLAHEQPDLVICDINGDTLGLLDAVRTDDGVASRTDPDVPLIALTRRPDELARVRYLEHGCDDVLSKPFGYPELCARVRSLLRRSRTRRHAHVTHVGALTVDHAARAVWVADTPVHLSGKEYELLVYLAADPTRTFTKHELLRDVWGFRSPGRTRTLDAHACRLRHKLSDPGHGRFMDNVWGVGYRLIAPPERIGRDAA